MFLLAAFNLVAQKDFSSTRYAKIEVRDTVVLDSLSFQPNSVHVVGDSLNYKELPFLGKVVFYPPFHTDSVVVRYKVFPLNFTTVIQPRVYGEQEEQQQDLISLNPYSFNREVGREDLFGGPGLKKSGSIARGVNVGNTQDLSVNSNLNLQLSGEFQGVEILASVTDNNIPIQPQGNTQTLQDFDRVFIQFSKDGHKVIAGDFQTQENKDVFLKYNKKAQGVSYSGGYNSKLFGKPATLNVKADAALSRGKFARNVFLGQEGNQGPYQLSGAENERFIIVLSGTERIYIDGKLLKRGMDEDYIIDYNTAELTFTTNRLITKDIRIVAEFQYSDQNYGRSLFNTSNEIKNENGRVFFNFYSEQDLRFQQLQQSLSAEQISLLNDVGDSLQLAISPQVDTVEFTQNQVLYAEEDSLVEGVVLTYYRYSTNADSARFSLGFSNVGAGNGNYILSNSTANGRVYSWVAPIGGQAQGDYEPVILIIAPKQQQMLTMGMDCKVGKNSKLFFEAALSNQDQNLFSDKNKEDDVGFALKTSFANTQIYKKKLNDSVTNTFQSKNTIGYQIIDNKFREIERFRDVEFTRDLNITQTNPSTVEQTFDWEWRLLKNNQQKVQTNIAYLDRRGTYWGLNSKAQLNVGVWKGAKINGKGSFVLSEDQQFNSSFLRHLVTFEQKVSKKLTLNLMEEEERNRTNNLVGDTLALTSFRYTVLGGGFDYGFTNNIKLAVNANQRLDYLPGNNQLNTVTTANNANAKFTFKNKKGTSFLWNSTYRELSINNAELVSVEPENTFLNRIDYKFKLWRGMLQSSSFVEIAAGSELRRQFQYVEVTPGQGVYTWIDYNNDSIQDLNEFEIAQFTDQANYVRVFLPATDFIKTYTNQFNQGLNINPARYFKRDTKVKKFITRFNNQFLAKLNQKISKDQNQRFQLPFQSSISDTNLISISSTLRNTVYFNRSNPIFGINYTYKTNQSKDLLTTGFEARELTSNDIDVRWNIKQKFTLRTKGTVSTKARASELFSAQDYEILSYELEPKLTYQKGSSFRVSINTALKDKRNAALFGGETSLFRKVGTEVTYNILKKGRMTGGVDYVNTTFSGEQTGTSPLLFDMLEGFQIGTNYTWNVNYTRTFKNNLQLSLRYEGRTSESARAVHTGNMQVQLLF